MNGGQAFEHAPHRMQVSASRKIGSSIISSRPLSMITQWSSRGPCTPIVSDCSMSADREGPVIQFTYAVISCPVPLRGSIRSTATASSSVATTLSIPNNAMWTGGSVVVRSALPSLVTSTIVPVSAMAMFAPDMPTVASINFSRSDSRA